MIVADIMNRDIVTVRPDTSLAEAAHWMVQHHISGLPVLDEAGRLVGILTEGDLLRRPELGTSHRQGGWLKGLMQTAALATEYAHRNGRHVGDVMTHNPTFVRPEMSLTKATELMLHKKVKRLPVLQDDILVGMLTRFDLLTALAPRLIISPEEASDVEISASLDAAITAEPWAPQSGIAINVKAGSVRLEGTVFTEEEARALRILVRNTRGVTDLIDLLEIAEPAIPRTITGW